MKVRLMLPTRDGAPVVGTILIGSGPRVRRAYRVLSARRSKGVAAIGHTTWSLAVDSIPAEAGRADIAAGVPTIGIMRRRR